MRDLPPGFDADYSCRNHPERPAIAPVALRRCEQCKREAERNYADPKAPIKAGIEYPTWADRGPLDLSIKGEFQGWYIPRKDDLFS